jgi:SAM-dependent methyltransferase
MNDVPDHLDYVGGELDLFVHATGWKRYWSGKVRPGIRGDVLEVGAGIGANTGLLINDQVRTWRCLEPDARLAGRLGAAIADGVLPDRCRVQVGTLAALPPQPAFDCILYIDVLEHIEDDQAELREAAARLRPGGRLIVLSPAHQALFSDFDAAIGHHRRYDRASLERCSPGGCRLSELYYLDSFGLLVSLANRLLLRQSMPTLAQIRLWDRFMIPVSRRLDPLLRYQLGKSIVAVWTAQSD